MTLNEIVGRCEQLEVYTKRTLTEEKAELVFYSKDTNEWNRLFTDIFGSAVKPAGVKPTASDLFLTRQYGGIDTGQTLFTKVFNNGVVMAMFWPWQSEDYTTLKLFLLPADSVAVADGKSGSIFGRIFRKLRGA